VQDEVCADAIACDDVAAAASLLAQAEEPRSTSEERPLEDTAAAREQATASPAFEAQVQAIFDLVAQGETAVRGALCDGTLLHLLQGTPESQRRSRPAKSRLLDQLSEDVKASMLADRATGMSYVKIDLKHGFTDAARTRGHVSWSVCKAAGHAQKEA
jgi:hypothetical protein